MNAKILSIGKKRCLGALLLLALLHAAFVSAQGIDVEFFLYPSGLAGTELETTYIPEADTESIIYVSDLAPENLRVYVEGKEAAYHFEGNLTIIEKAVKKGKQLNLKFAFDTKELVLQEKNSYIFSFVYLPQQPGNHFSINVSLPDGFVLADIASPASPHNYRTFSDGKRIIINWAYAGLSEETSFIVVYKRGQSSDEFPIVPIISLCLLAMMMMLLFLFYRRKKKRFVIGTLGATEKKIIDLIVRDNEITQKQIVKELLLSKAQVSKIVRRLEEKGIVEKKPFSTTNMLRLTKGMKL